MDEIKQHTLKAKQAFDEKLAEIKQKREESMKKHSEDWSLEKSKLKELRTKFNEMTEQELVRIAKL
jgi:hypothetical protein